MQVHKCNEPVAPAETHPLSFADILMQEGVYESKSFPKELVIVIHGWRSDPVHFRFSNNEIDPTNDTLREGPFRKLDKKVCFELKDA